MELWLSAICIVVLALLIDRFIGEVPNSIHPLRWIGNTVSFLDRHIKRTSKHATRLKGFLSYLLVAIIFMTVSITISALCRHFLGDIVWIIVSAFLFKVNFAIFSFRKHVIPIQKDLENGDLDAAAAKTQMIVSRKTAGMDAEHIASSCTETISENLVDSVVSPTLFFGLLGLPGAIMFRCANLMDAMWGYLNEKYGNLGFFPAKFDDVLGFIGARVSIFFVTVAAFILRMNWRDVVSMAREGKDLTPSPNSAWSMVACAAALDIRMEKVGVYVMGKGDMPTVKDITRCYHLVELTSIIFIVCITLPLYAFIGIDVQVFVEDLILRIGDLIL
ncbi:MAG: cobalamin biosynthesis protein [Candidatus Methanomethylophilaceae archaeon]|nr:cobalamin biosynthesis protein [Candidatus Methanomethylophilaceae archaeon]